MGKYSNFAKELKNSRHEVTVMSFVVGVFEMVPKDSERGLEELEIRGRVETIDTVLL